LVTIKRAAPTARLFRIQPNVPQDLINIAHSGRRCPRFGCRPITIEPLPLFNYAQVMPKNLRFTRL
jgi:hypothetical protein